MESESIRSKWSKRKNSLILKSISSIFSYFFDMTPSPFFEIVFFNPSYCTICVVGSFVAVDFLFFIFGVCFVEHLKFFQEKIRQLNENSKNLSEIIELYKQACDFFAKLNRIFAPQLVIKSLSVAIFVCICGFTLTEVS